MQVATEIVTLKVNEDFTPELCDQALASLNPPPPGFLSGRWGFTVGDRKTVIAFQNWGSIEEHVEFMKSPIAGPFLTSIMALCVEPIAYYHTLLQPSPPYKIFDAGVIELANVAKKPEASREELATALGKLLDLAAKAPGYHSHFHGTKHQDPDVYVMLVGWDSVESHTAFMASEAMKEVQGIAGAVAAWENSSFCYVKLN